MLHKATTINVILILTFKLLRWVVISFSFVWCLMLCLILLWDHCLQFTAIKCCLIRHHISIFLPLLLIWMQSIYKVLVSLFHIRTCAMSWSNTTRSRLRFGEIKILCLLFKELQAYSWIDWLAYWIVPISGVGR